jgi:hypothetical protein
MLLVMTFALLRVMVMIHHLFASLNQNLIQASLTADQSQKACELFLQEDPLGEAKWMILIVEL